MWVRDDRVQVSHWLCNMFLLFCILQFSFRGPKDKHDKKSKQRLGEVDEECEVDDSGQPSKVQTMSNDEVNLRLEQMLVSVIS